MKPDEIINALNAVKEVYQPKNAQAIDAAIQAVKTLEEIKATGKGKCKFCKHLAADTTELPCRDCFDDNDLWEFRWPLGKDTNT